MKELLNQLALKNGRMKPNAKAKAKLMEIAAEKKGADALIAKLALEASKDHVHKKRDPSVGASETDNVKFENDMANFTSAEELENILQKLKLMGAKGQRVFELLKKQVTLNVNESPTTTPLPTTTEHPTSTTSQFTETVKESESDEENLLRQKREFVLKTAMKHKELNEEEEENENLAIEEVTPNVIPSHAVFNFFLTQLGIPTGWNC